MASGDVIEVVPGVVYQGATDFSEFALQDMGATLPPGITGFDNLAEFDAYGILLDPTEGNYFAARNIGGSNQFGAFGIDSFDQTPNQNVIEVLIRVQAPDDFVSSGRGWWGPGFSMTAAPTWRQSHYEDGPTPTGNIRIYSGSRGSGLISNADSGIAKQPGVFHWARYRRVQYTATLGKPTDEFVKVWYGAYEDEPAGWQGQFLGASTAVSGPLGDDAIGLAASLIANAGRVYACSFLSFTTGETEADLDAYPPLTPSQIGNPWEPVDPVTTAWDECGAATEALTVELTTSGLVFRDEFDRADSQSLGNGWTDWEALATDIQIVNEEVVAAAVKRDIGGARPDDEVGDTQDILVQMNTHSSNGNAIMGVMARWVGVSNPSPSYLCRADLRSGGVWGIIRNNSSIVASSTVAPRPVTNQWRGLRMVISGAEVRFLATGVLADGDDVTEDFAVVVTYTDGNPLVANNKTGFNRDALAAAAQFDQYILCSDPNITVNGLPTGFKAQVDSRTAEVESGGTATINAETYALPATTLNILDASDNVVASVTPAEGVYAGDVYTVTGSGGGGATVWEECD